MKPFMNNSMLIWMEATHYVEEQVNVASPAIGSTSATGTGGDAVPSPTDETNGDAEVAHALH